MSMVFSILKDGAPHVYLSRTAVPLHLFDWEKRVAPEPLRAVRSVMRISQSTESLQLVAARSSQAAPCERVVGFERRDKRQK